ncbi:MAG TPA: hypothetical protein VLI04_08630 [Nocardioidaceae bacterium]|nr:hypothetical protein [Nocardioidaceae bacterium]
MKGAVAAMAVGGVLAIGGLPTAALLAADNEFGGEKSDRQSLLHERLVLLGEGHGKEHGKSPKWGERGPDLFPRLHEWGPAPPGFPNGLPKDMEELREWMRCAFEERQHGTELENLEEKCGEAPTPRR